MELDLNAAVDAVYAKLGSMSDWNAVLPAVSGLEFWTAASGGTQLTPDGNGDLVDDAFPSSGQYDRKVWVSIDPSAASTFDTADIDFTVEQNAIGAQVQCAVAVQPGVDVYMGAVSVGPGGVGAHTFLLIPNGNGGYNIFRGGPSGANPKQQKLQVDFTAWKPGGIDYPKPGDKYKTWFVQFTVPYAGGAAALTNRMSQIASDINNQRLNYDVTAGQLLNNAPETAGATCNSATTWALDLTAGGWPRLPSWFKSRMGLSSFGGFRECPPKALNPKGAVFAPLNVTTTAPTTTPP